MSKKEKPSENPDPDDVLRRMLKTPPAFHKDNKKEKKKKADKQKAGRGTRPEA